MTNEKINFLNKLKDSPYSDKLINMWLETLQDDYNCSQYLESIKLNNSQWESYKQHGISVDEYNQCVVNHYKDIQGLPHTLVIPILVGSCDEISNSFLASEMMKNLEIIHFNCV